MNFMSNSFRHFAPNLAQLGQKCTFYVNMVSVKVIKLMTQQSAAFKKVSGQTLKVSCCEKRVTKKTNIKHQTSQLSSTRHVIKTAAESGSGKVQFIVFPRARSDQNNAFQNHREPKKKVLLLGSKSLLIQHSTLRAKRATHIFKERIFEIFQISCQKSTLDV